MKLLVDIFGNVKSSILATVLTASFICINFCSLMAPLEQNFTNPDLILAYFQKKFCFRVRNF